MLTSAVVRRFLSRGGWVIALSGFVALALGTIISANRAPTYRSTASFVVSLDVSEGGLDFGDRVYGLDSLNRRNTIATYSEILISERIVDAAFGELSSPSERESYAVAAVVLPETSIIRVSVTGPNPKVATALLLGISSQAEIFISTIDDVYRLTSLDNATTPSSSIGPNPSRDGLVAGLLGLLLGSIIAIARTPEILGDSSKLPSLNRRQPSMPVHERNPPPPTLPAKDHPQHPQAQNGAHGGTSVKAK